MITTPVSPAHILKGSPSPTSSTTGTGGKKTSRPPKGSKQFSSPLSNNQSSPSSSIPPMTPNDQLPQQHVPPFKGPVIPPPTHFPYFPMNPMAVANVPLMYAPINPIHMIPTTTPMFGMFPQPVMPPTIPPPTTPNSMQKIPPPIQPKPSTTISEPSSSSSTTVTSHPSKPKPKRKKKSANNSNNTSNATPSNRNVNSENSNINNTSPITGGSTIINDSKPSKSHQQKRKAPTTSRSIHEHIISYLWELGLKDSAKILENDLDNPLLLNASEDRVSSFVHNLSNQIERHSHTIIPSNKKISTSNETSTTSNSAKLEETNDSFMTESNNMTDKYNPETFLNVLKQTTKPGSYNKPTAEHINERLENIEETLGVKEKKVEIFSRVQEVEEQLLKLDVNNVEQTEVKSSTQQLQNQDNNQEDPLMMDSSETHDDNFFDSFFDTSDYHNTPGSHF